MRFCPPFLQRPVAGVLVAALLFLSSAPSWAEAEFWTERRRASQRTSSVPSVPRETPSDLITRSLTDLPVPAAPAEILRDAALPSWMRSLSWANADLQEIARVPGSERWVVLLQDLHGHEEAQRNISRLIRDLAGKDVLVGVEGASGPFDFGPYRR